MGNSSSGHVGVSTVAPWFLATQLSNCCINSLVEFATVILVACFPTFPKLFKYFGKRESTSQYGDGKGPKPAQSGDTKFITAWYKESKKSGLRTYIPLQDRRPGPAVEEMDVHPNASLRRDGGEIHKQVDIRVVSSAV